jgi:ATPase family associated with various cellular activities (AAA)
MPSFSDSSSAILSSPHVGFSWAIRRTSSRTSLGSAGRPGLRDFHRQNILKALRCHLTNVSGFTASRQSKNLASATIATRIEAVVRRGLALRSWNMANCFRRKRFSATRPVREEKNSRMNVSNFVFYKSLRSFLPFGPNFCGVQPWTLPVVTFGSESGWILCLGTPTAGKTLSIVTIAKCLDASFRRIKFTPDVSWQVRTSSVWFHLTKGRRTPEPCRS